MRDRDQLLEHGGLGHGLAVYRRVGQFPGLGLRAVQQPHDQRRPGVVGRRVQQVGESREHRTLLRDVVGDRRHGDVFALRESREVVAGDDSVVVGAAL